MFGRDTHHYSPINYSYTILLLLNIIIYSSEGPSELELHIYRCAGCGKYMSLARKEDFKHYDNCKVIACINLYV